MNYSDIDVTSRDGADDDDDDSDDVVVVEPATLQGNMGVGSQVGVIGSSKSGRVHRQPFKSMAAGAATVV
jgi:hypothetical protein